MMRDHSVHNAFMRYLSPVMSLLGKLQLYVWLINYLSSNDHNKTVRFYEALISQLILKGSEWDKVCGSQIPQESEIETQDMFLMMG